MDNTLYASEIEFVNLTDHEIRLGDGLIQHPPAFGCVAEDHLEMANNTFGRYAL